MSFRDRNGMDGLGFDFEIDLSTAQTVMVVRLLISPARWREGEVVVEGILGAELICGSGLIWWLWMWSFFSFSFFLYCCLWLQWI